MKISRAADPISPFLQESRIWATHIQRRIYMNMYVEGLNGENNN